jgi:hypothetical protein
MTGEDEVIDEEEDARSIPGQLTGWELIVFELADEEEPAD